MQSVKLVVVGDGNAGKSCMLLSYIYSQFPNTNIPTVSEKYKASILFDGLPINLSLYDTAGSCSYDRLRPRTYPGTDVFLFCYSVGSPDSYENIREKWLPEIKHHCPNAPIVLVGTKLDLRSDEQTMKQLRKYNLSPVSREDGARLAQEIHAIKHLECSALTHDGLEEVIMESVQAALTNIVKSKESTKKKTCSLL